MELCAQSAVINREDWALTSEEKQDRKKDRREGRRKEETIGLMCLVIWLAVEIDEEVLKLLQSPCRGSIL